MALMEAPTTEARNRQASEDQVDSAYVAHLEEGNDPEQENLNYSELVNHITSAFRRAKDGRKGDEERWLLAYRNYRGIYGPDVKFTETEKSRAFIKITKTKVHAAYAQLVDVLFAGGKFPLGVEAPHDPVGVADSVSFDPKAPPKDGGKETGQNGEEEERPARTARPELETLLGPYKSTLEPLGEEVVEGPGDTPTAVTWEPAKKAAKNMELKIHDQLEESEASKHLRAVAFEMALFGTGILKGPFAYDKEYPRWTEDGTYEPEIRTIPKVEGVSIWDIYPDPDARNIGEAEFMVQRHRMNRPQMRALKNRPHFRDESIEIALEMGPSYQQEIWEDVLDDHEGTLKPDRYEVLEYWGIIDREVAEENDIEIPSELKDEVDLQVNAWICNDQILRLVLNPFKPRRIPYNAVPYELNPYGFFGIGIAENMEDTQLLMNGFMRMAVDNGALSGNLLIEIDETNLVPGQDLSVYPGKVFRRQAGAPGQAIFGTKFPNVSQELFMMFDKARQLADESTGMPSYSHGMSGVQGVGRTAAGMSMLMGAAATNIKSVVRNIDDYLLAPLGRALFAFNMQFNFDPETVGSLVVVARGTESLMRNEVRSQRLLQFMQMTANPMMQPFVKYDYILRELAASMDLDEEKILNDPREALIQAKLMSEVMQAQGVPPDQAQPPQGGPNGPPPVSDPTQTGNGNIGPGMAPEPGAQGYTGAGGGANGGNPAQPPQPQQAA